MDRGRVTVAYLRNNLVNKTTFYFVRVPSVAVLVFFFNQFYSCFYIFRQRGTLFNFFL